MRAACSAFGTSTLMGRPSGRRDRIAGRSIPPSPGQSRAGDAYHAGIGRIVGHRPVTYLDVVQHLARDLRNFVQRAVAAVEMQRVEQDRRGRVGGGFHQGAGIGDVAHRGPGHEFEIRGHAVLPDGFAEPAIRVGDPRAIRVVARHQKVPRPQRLPPFEEGPQRLGVGIGIHPNHLEIGHFEPAFLQRGPRRGKQRVIGQQRRRHVARSGGQHAKADPVETEFCGKVHRLDGAQPVGRQVGH